MGARELIMVRVQGDTSVHHARWDIWAALNDPAVWCPCIPGCESIEHLGRNMQLVRLVQPGDRLDGVGRHALVEACGHMPPERLRWRVRRATPAGSIEALVTITLRDRGRFTLLSYEIDVSGSAVSPRVERSLYNATSWLARQFITALLAQMIRRR